MKKQQIKSLRLNKKSVANMSGGILGGIGATCEGPCRGGLVAVIELLHYVYLKLEIINVIACLEIIKISPAN